MLALKRAGFPRRAIEAYREYGRACVVIIEGRDEPHDGFLDELQATLADEEEAAGIVRAAEEAVAAYDPESEAVVIEKRTEGIFVVIVGAVETRVIGEFFWSSTH